MERRVGTSRTRQEATCVKHAEMKLSPTLSALDMALHPAAPVMATTLPDRTTKISQLPKFTYVIAPARYRRYLPRTDERGLPSADAVMQ